MTPRAGVVICVCAHIERRAGGAPCSRCRRGYTKRVTPDRLAALRAIAANPRAAIKDRVVRKACIDLRLLSVVQAAPPNDTGRRRRDPPWELSVTPAGTAVLEAVQAHEVATEHGRHDVAASVARHADLDEDELLREIASAPPRKAGAKS